MRKLDIHIFGQYQYWQDALLTAILVTTAASIEKHFFDFPKSDDWSWVMWTLHATTILLAIKVLFFNIKIKEVRSLYYSMIGLDQVLDGLQKEDKEVRSRLMVPLIEKMAKEPDEYGTLLINIKDPGVLQMISNICSEEADERLLKLAKHSSTAAQDAHINFNSREIKAFADQIKQFEKIKEYCDKSTP